MTVYGDRWERNFLGTRETAANSNVLLNTFHVNTMFACRCSEMIYYTCNMKPARRRSARRTWVSRHVVVSVSLSWLRRCKFFSPASESFIDIMLYGSFENINKTRLEDETKAKKASPSRRREHQWNKTCRNWCVFIKHTSASGFVHQNQFEIRWFDMFSASHSVTSHLSPKKVEFETRKQLRDK